MSNSKTNNTQSYEDFLKEKFKEAVERNTKEDEYGTGYYEALKTSIKAWKEMPLLQYIGFLQDGLNSTARKMGVDNFEVFGANDGYAVAWDFFLDGKYYEVNKTL